MPRARLFAFVVWLAGTLALLGAAPVTSIYLTPPGGWTYRYEGSNMANSGTNALDGTWNHDNGSDAWAGDLRGAGNLPEGGLSVTDGILTLEDVLVSGSGIDNRRLYFTHPLTQDSVTNANTMLNDGVTFTFRARLTPLTDPLIELTNPPNGFINVADGKGMIGMRQSGNSGMIISFSLNMAAEDTNATTMYNFPAAGLHMNNLNGNVRGPNVDPGEAGTVNVFPVDPAEFHEFWITVQDNGVDPGTHRVSVYADGSTTATVFNVTAGIGSDTPITNYLALGLPSAFQRGAFDLDWLGYKQGVHLPAAANEPVQIVAQPASQIVNEGQTATFTVSVTGTPPISYQWLSNGVPIAGATDSSYTTVAALPPHNETVFRVECQNVAGAATSDPATLTVNGDNTPPVLLTAASLNGPSIGVCFDERVTAASAQNIANYFVNNGQVTVTSATLRPNANGTTVLLQVSGLGSQIGTVFTVRATNIIDASFAGNSGGGTVQGVVHGLTPADVGVANGASFTCASNRFEISAGGSGLGGSADAFHFVSMARTGDFDVRVRLVTSAATGPGQVGLVARADQTPGSRTLNVFLTPTAYNATYRAAVNGSMASWPGATSPPVSANAWIRLTRAGDTFVAHHGTNGSNWQSYAQVTESLPATMLVGMGGAGLADSLLDDLIFIPPPQILTEPGSAVATNGDTVSFSVQAVSRAEIWYQWRLNGADLLNQTNPTLLLTGVHPSQTGTYTVRVANGGGVVLSAPATLTVRTLDYGDASAAYPTLLANNGARHLLAPGIRLGAAVDFELNGLPSASANGDDLDGTDDEDGVRLVSPLWVDQTATIEVVASTNGVLNAWIDYGADGSWAQPEDHVFADYALEPGTNLLSLNVPFDAKGTNTFARFRFSSVGGLAPNGAAIDGEVEDYVMAVIPVADLSIAALDSPDPVAVGSNLTFQVSIGNVGPAIATAVTVTNAFSVPVEFVSAVSTRGSCVNNSGTINCSIGDLGVGSNATITVIVRPLQGGSLSSSFGIQAAQPDPNTGNNLAASVTTVELPPVITAQPASLTVTQHNTATFSVTANGTPPLGYQWFHNGSPLLNRTNPTLVISDALNANQGTYHARVTNRVGATLSQTATLTVLDPPVITQQPQSRTNLAGSTAIFSVVAGGTPPLTYQWFFNVSNLLPGETGPSLTLANVQKSQAGAYSVRVTNSAGVTNSVGAVLTVIEMDFGDAPAPFPTLLSDNGARHRIVPGFQLGAAADFEPDGQAADGADEDGVIFQSALLLGQSARIDVTASSNGVLNAWVDWNGNGNWSDAGERIFVDRALTAGVNILNATVPAGAQVGARAARFRFSSATGLSFTNEALNGEVEDYTVNVQGAIDVAVTATANPESVRVGSNVVYSILVTNRGPSAASGVVVTSALPASVSVTSLPGSCANQGGLVTCNLGTLAAATSSSLQITIVPGQSGMVTNHVSVTAVGTDTAPTNNTTMSVVAVLEFPAIVSQPQSLTVTSSDAASFQVTATGTALSYQWTFNGSDIPGATSSSFTINPAQPVNEGTYRVRVSNALGQVVSDPAQLTVLVPPNVVSHPASITVVAGDTAAFNVSASGTPPLQYQWTFGGADLPGENNATLSVPNVSAAHEGVYRVRVSNAAGETLSNPANLVVLVPATITQQPQSKTVFAGANPSLDVVAAGTEPIRYQWFAGTLALAGKTNPVLNLPNVQVSQTGPYTVVVSNSVKVVTSLVAQLTVRQADFGDADGPSYSTLLVFSGAYHYLSPGVRLGAAVDFEPDGQPAPNADGDDLAGADDEDGVTFAASLFVGQVGSVTVSASTNGLLDAWIDFNGNGDWTDSGEQVFANRPLVSGNNSLQFTIPAGALAHNALSRFRFSTAGGLSFSGGGADGEVEDHVARILPAIDLRVTLIDQPDPALVESNLHLFITVSNAGPSTATSVVLREQLPSSAGFLSATLTQGSCSNQAGLLVCDLGNILAGGSVAIDVELMPHGIGIAAHRAELLAPEHDLNPANNVAVQSTTVVTMAGPFTNSTYIAINDFGPASIYPSTIQVSGVTGTVHQVIVTLNNLSHVFPDDLDILLVGPRGQRVILMSDAGGANDPVYTIFSLDDTSDLILPDDDLIIDEPYQPANYHNSGDTDNFDSPAPGGPYTNRLAAFRGSDPNGVWSLYIMDDFAQDSGELAGGWSLSFLVLDPFADASLGIAAGPEPAAIGQPLTYTLSVTNGGPAAVAQMLVTNVLPAGVLFQSLSASQGACTRSGSEITCDLGVMEAGASASITFIVTPQQAGVLSNYARITPSQMDLNPGNNSAVLLTPVRFRADIAITTVESRDPVPVNQPLTYTLTVSNRGPQLAQSLVVSNQLPNNFQFASVTASQGSCLNQSGAVLCELGDLAAGNFATIQITGQGTRIGRMTNSATVQGNNFDSDLSNNQSTEETVVVFAAPAFVNSAGIAVPNPYPSTLQVSGLTGAVYKVSVIISNLNHSTPENLRLLLVGPSGQNVLLMNSVGGNTAIANGTLRLDDQAAAPLPDGSPLVSGSYRPASYSVAASLPAPAPPIPYGNVLSVFRGAEANGAWSLFTQGGGSIGAWALEISTLEAIADLSMNIVSEPAAVSVSSNLTYIITVSNRGPAVASAILFTNLLPASFGVISATGCTNKCDLGFLSAGTQLQIRVNGVALAEGFATNAASAFAAEHDLNPANNVASVTTFMKTPPIISTQPQSLTVTNGGTAVFTVGVTGAGPFTYQWIGLPGETNAMLVINNVQQANAGDYAVRVSDGVGSPLSASARLTVLNRPTISDVGNLTLPEDTPSAELPFVIGDFEPGALTLEAVASNPALISLLVTGTGNDRFIKVLPATNQSGSATVTLTVRDADGLTASDSFDVTVTPVNDLPVLVSVPNQTMEEDSQRNIPLQVADVEDAEGQLILAAESSDLNLLAATIVDRTLTLSPQPDQFGTARVSVTLRDTAGGAVSNAFDVVVHPVNDPPTLTAISTVTLEEDAGLTSVPLTGISSGAANEPQTLAVRASLSNSNLLTAFTVNYTSGASGSLSFSTVSNVTGNVTITVAVDDGGASNNIVTRAFLVIIGGVNDQPFISSIADQIIAEDTPAQINITIGDDETPADALLLASASSNPSLVRTSNIVFLGSGAARTLSVTPEPNQSGSAIITISVSDGENTVTEPFQLQVSPVNDPPTVDVISLLNLPENSPAQIIALGHLTAGAPDEPHNLLITASSSNPALVPDPLVQYDNPNTNGTLTLAPRPDLNGTAVITIVVNDRGSSNNLAIRTLIVNISDQNNVPAISQIFNQTTPEETPIDIPFTVFDSDSPLHTLVLTAISADSALIPNETLVITGTGANRSLRAVPSANASGFSSITVTVTDTNGASSSATFMLAVSPINDAPVLGNIPDQQIIEDTVMGLLFFYVDDLETTPGALTLSGASSNPALVPQSRIAFGGVGTNRWIRIIPALNRSGSTIITVTVRDADGGAADDSFVLTVHPTNDPPVISAIADHTITGAPSALIPFTINDLETVPDFLQLTVTSSNPALLPNTNIVFGGASVDRSALLTPVSGVTGSSTVNITVTDGSGGSASESFLFQVSSGSGPPVITLHPESQTATNGATVVFSSASSGAPTLRYRWRFNGTNLPAAIATNATLVITKVEAVDAGDYAIAIGNSLGSVTSLVATLTVVGSEIPTLANIPDQVTSEDVPLTLNLALRDFDTPPHFLVVSATGTNTTLVPPANYLHEGSGLGRTLTIVPAPHQFGTNLVTVTVSDGVFSSSDTFVLRITAVNDAPTLDRLPAVSALANATATVPLTGISPGGTNETSIVTLSAVHNNPAVLTNLTINYTPGETTGTLSAFVLSNATGSATITVTATDGGPSTLRTFQIVVRPLTNSNPTIAGITNLVINEDTSTGPIGFTVDDPNASPTQVTVTPLSHHTNLVVVSGISFSGTGASRTMTITPVTNQSGSATITLTVGDSAAGITTTNFTITVNPVNDLPILPAIAGRILNEDTPSAPIPIFVRDLETVPGALVLTGASANQSLIPNTNLLFGGSGSNRVLVIKPADLQIGSTLITVTLTDQNGGSVSTNFNVTVNAVDDTPRISTIPDVTIPPNSSTGPLPFTISDEETPGSLSVSVVSSDNTLVPPGAISLSGLTTNRTVTIQPAAGRSGACTITVNVSDGNTVGSEFFILRVTQSETNAPPTLDALPDIFVNEDAIASTISLAGISAGANEPAQVVAISARSANRDLIPDPIVTYTSPNPTGTLLLAPYPGTNGTTTVTVTVHDGSALFSRLFNVTVRARPILALINDLTTEEDTSRAITVAASDLETPTSNLLFSAASSNPSLIPAANVIVTGLDTNRTLTITPTPDQFGHALITLSVADAHGLARSNSFIVVVNPVNDPPTLDPLSSPLVLSEDQGPRILDLTGISSGAANESQSLMLAVSSSNPSIVPPPTIDYTSPNTTGSLTFTPPPNAYGSSTITVTVNDGQSLNQNTTATFEITVNPINDPPTLNPLSDLTLDYDPGPQSVTLTGITAGDPNEGQTVTIQPSSSNPALVSNLVVTYTYPDTIGTLTLTPNPGAAGTATITLAVSDGQNTVTQNFLFTINPLPLQISVGELDDQTIPEDSVAGPINFIIDDGGAPSIELSALSSNPTLIHPSRITFSGAGTNRSVTLAPQTNQFGTAIITVVLRAAGNTASNSFQLTVNPIDDFPYFVQSVPDLIMDEDTTLTIPFVVNDAETPPPLVVGRTSYNRELIPDDRIELIYHAPPNYLIVFKPRPNQSGTALIELRVRDGILQRATNNIRVTVRPVEDPPTVSPLADQIIREDQDFEIGFFVDDIETPAANLVITAASSDTNLLANDAFQHINEGRTRILRARPALNQSGSNVVTVTVHDEAGATATATFNLVVLPENDPPVISPIGGASVPVSQSTADIPFSISDAETAPNLLTLSARSSNTNLAPVSGIQFSGTGASRTVRVTPASGQTGLAVITVEVSDPDNATTQTTFELLVNATNGPPVIVLNPQDQRVNIGQPITLRVLATGPAPLTYQWQRDTVDLPGQTSPTLAFPSAQPVHRGVYRARATNPNGATTSLSANLQVFEPARILSVTLSGGVARIISQSAIGQRYTLEFCDQLAADAWTPIETLDGTGSPLTFTDPTPPATSRFYRLRIE